MGLEFKVICDKCGDELDVYCKNRLLKSNEFHSCYGEKIGSVLDVSSNNFVKLRQDVRFEFE